jgi:arginine/ornithine N-succinyltransferase beta subunit
MSKKDRPAVKVPKGNIGRLVFAGGQVAAALAAVRAVKDARRRGDRLALVHGALTAALVAVTAVVAVRTVREQSAEAAGTAGDEAAAPKALTSGPAK